MTPQRLRSSDGQWTQVRRPSWVAYQPEPRQHFYTTPRSVPDRQRHKMCQFVEQCLLSRFSQTQQRALGSSSKYTLEKDFQCIVLKSPSQSMWSHSACNLDPPDPVRVPPLVCQSLEVVHGAFHALLERETNLRDYEMGILVSGTSQSRLTAVMLLKFLQITPNQICLDLGLDWERLFDSLGKHLPQECQLEVRSGFPEPNPSLVSAKPFTWLKSGRAHGSTLSTCSPSESPDSISNQSTSSTSPTRSGSETDRVAGHEMMKTQTDDRSTPLFSTPMRRAIKRSTGAKYWSQLRTKVRALGCLGMHKSRRTFSLLA